MSSENDVPTFRAGTSQGAKEGASVPTEHGETGKKRFSVLALHGGGIRGAATAAYLADLEERINGRIRDYFDLITGTSTGGLIALGLSRDISAERVLALYKEEGEELFVRRRPPILPEGLADWILPNWLTRLFVPVYRGGPLKDKLQEVFKTGTLLGEAECSLCIPTVNLETGETVVLKTDHHKDFERDHQLPMWRVAAATSAAPTYFPPAKIPERGWFVDGGLWANAPIEVGLAEGRKLGYQLDEIEILSIGTGRSTFHKRGVPSWLGVFRHGLLGWNFGLVELTMRTQTQRARNVTRYLRPGKFCHIDFPLPEDMGGLDALGDVDKLVKRARKKAKDTTRDVRKEFFGLHEAAPDSVSEG